MTQLAALPATRSNDFGPLRKRIQQADLMGRRTRYYAVLIAANLLFLAALWALAGLIGDSWWVIALALPMAVSTAHTSFVGHDAGHHQIARSAKVNRALGLFHGNLLGGMSFGWWTRKHNQHHAHPNDAEKDPDVGAGVLVWCKDQARVRRGFGAWFARHQAAFFFPLLLLEGLNLKASSIRDLRKRDGNRRRLESWLLVAHWVLYFGLLFTLLSPTQGLVFFLVHQGLFGIYLGCAFAPNHKGMPMPQPGQEWTHMERQVLTSRNVRGGPVVDIVLGGLNYQIEHHLFPTMPRPNLRKAQPIIRDYCDEVGLPYVESGLIESYAEGLRHMREVGADH